MSEHVHHVQELVFPVGYLRASIALPSPEGDTFDHQLHGFCWCQPLVEDDLTFGHIYVHRRSLDSPHIERIEGLTTA